LDIEKSMRGGNPLRVSEQQNQHQVRVATGVQIPVPGFVALPGNIRLFTFLS